MRRKIYFVKVNFSWSPPPFQRTIKKMYTLGRKTKKQRKKIEKKNVLENLCKSCQMMLKRVNKFRVTATCVTLFYVLNFWIALEIPVRRPCGIILYAAWSIWIHLNEPDTADCTRIVIKQICYILNNRSSIEHTLAACFLFSVFLFFFLQHKEDTWIRYEELQHCRGK